MKKNNEIKLTKAEIKKGCAEFLALVRKKQVPKFFLDEARREVNKLFGTKLFPIEPIDPDKTQ